MSCFHKKPKTTASSSLMMYFPVMSFSGMNIYTTRHAFRCIPQTPSVQERLISSTKGCGFLFQSVQLDFQETQMCLLLGWNENLHPRWWTFLLIWLDTSGLGEGGGGGFRSVLSAKHVWWNNPRWILVPGVNGIIVTEHTDEASILYFMTCDAFNSWGKGTDMSHTV